MGARSRCLIWLRGACVILALAMLGPASWAKAPVRLTVADLLPAVEGATGPTAMEVKVKLTSGDQGDYLVHPFDWVDGGTMATAIGQALGRTPPTGFGDLEGLELDMWLDRVQSSLKVFGEGMIVDLTAVWRVTRRADGAVLACAFVDAHGAGRGMGNTAHRVALKAALQDLIGRLAEAMASGGKADSTARAAAFRASLGTAVPAEWPRVTGAWTKLAKGMERDSVLRLLDPEGVLFEPQLVRDPVNFMIARSVLVGPKVLYKFEEDRSTVVHPVQLLLRTNRIKTGGLWRSKLELRGGSDSSGSALQSAFVQGTPFPTDSLRYARLNLVCMADFASVEVIAQVKDGLRSQTEHFGSDLFWLTFQDGLLQRWEWRTAPYGVAAQGK